MKDKFLCSKVQFACDVQHYLKQLLSYEERKLSDYN